MFAIYLTCWSCDCVDGFYENYRFFEFHCDWALCVRNPCNDHGWNFEGRKSEHYYSPLPLGHE